MRIIVLWCVIVFILAILAVGVYYVIYSRKINKKICEGNSAQKKMLDIPQVVGIVMCTILILYTLIVSYDYKQYRNNIETQMKNRNNIAQIDLEDYTYCGYSGNIELEDASFFKVYSKDKNEGYKKTVSKEGNFTFTIFTRTSVHDDFHPDFLCYVEYTGEIKDEYDLYENYEYLDKTGNECGGVGSAGADASKEYMYVGNINEGQSVKIELGILGEEATQKFVKAEEEAMQNKADSMPHFSDYADEYGCAIVEVD